MSLYFISQYGDKVIEGNTDTPFSRNHKVIEKLISQYKVRIHNLELQRTKRGKNEN